MVVSDFEWCPLMDDTLNLLENARKEGMKIFSLRVGYDFGMDYDIDMDDDSDPDYDRYRYNGYHFFTNSDYKFSYEDGYIQEL